MIKIKGDMAKALEVSKWLKDKGYVHDKDYTWHRQMVIGSLRSTIIIIECKNPELETLIGLYWAE